MGTSWLRKRWAFSTETVLMPDSIPPDTALSERRKAFEKRVDADLAPIRNLLDEMRAELERLSTGGDGD